MTYLLHIIIIVSMLGLTSVYITTTTDKSALCALATDDLALGLRHLGCRVSVEHQQSYRISLDTIHTILGMHFKEIELPSSLLDTFLGR